MMNNLDTQIEYLKKLVTLPEGTLLQFDTLTAVPETGIFGESNWETKEIMKAVNHEHVTKRILDHYTQNITREEFCELAIKLYEKKFNRSLKRSL